MCVLLAPLRVRAEEGPAYPPPAEVRSAFRKLLDRPAVPPNVKVHETRREEGLGVERLSFASEKRDHLPLPERVRAALLGTHRFGPAALRRAERLTRAAEVLKYVFSAVRHFVEVLRPAVLTFDGGDDEELTFTFQVLAARFAHDMGCRLEGLSLVGEQGERGPSGPCCPQGTGG